MEMFEQKATNDNNNISEKCTKVEKTITEVIEEKENNIYKLKLWNSLLLFLCLVTIFFLLSSLLKHRLYYEKKPIQDTIKAIIINGGELELIKHVYNTRELKREIFTERAFGIPKGKYYEEDYPLSSILNDLKKNFYIDQEKKNNQNQKDRTAKCFILEERDSVYLSLLNNVIDENNKKYPFDILEENQKYNFVNVQQKLDSDYVKVSGDVSKIVDELNNKNQLVTKYLNDSKTSLTISWIALIVSIILAVYQIYQNWNTSKQHNKRFDEIEKMINKKE